MNPDVNININLTGSSAGVSGVADIAAETAMPGPPPEMHSSVQASTSGRGLQAPGPEDSEQADAVAGGPPGPEAVNASTGFAAAPPPYELQTSAGMGRSTDSAPGPEGTGTLVASAASNSPPAPDLGAAESAAVVKKTARKKTANKKSRAKKNK